MEQNVPKKMHELKSQQIAIQVIISEELWGYFLLPFLNIKSIPNR